MAVEQETVNVANQVIRAVFEDMLKSVGRYGDLDGLGPDHLSLNEFGILQIHFVQRNVPRPEINPPLEIGVAAVPLGQVDVWGQDHPSFELMYPFLDLKIVGYQVDNKKARQYPLIKTIMTQGHWLDEHQQLHLPFRMSIIPDQPEFGVGETVGFVVRLENHSGLNLTVRQISEETLYLNIDGAEWGAREIAGGGDQRRGRVILRPGESIQKHFNVGPYGRKGEVDIYGIYHITFEGVNPAGRVRIKIIPAANS